MAQKIQEDSRIFRRLYPEDPSIGILLFVWNICRGEFEYDTNEWTVTCQGDTKHVWVNKHVRQNSKVVRTEKPVGKVSVSVNSIRYIMVNGFKHTLDLEMVWKRGEKNCFPKKLTQHVHEIASASEDANGVYGFLESLFSAMEDKKEDKVIYLREAIRHAYKTNIELNSSII